MSEALLTLNAGSSSLKFAVFTPGENGGLSALLQGQLAGIGGDVVFSAGATTGSGLDVPAVKNSLAGIPDHAAAIQYTLNWLSTQLTGINIIAAGHRVVHGGQNFTRPERVDAKLITALEKLIPLAPHHQPHNLAAIKALADQHPDLPQVACFDTAFHASQPEVATRLPIPQHYHEQGVRRYGFHGLSYQYIAAELAQLEGGIPPRTIIAHLGNGASLCALRDGQSIATSMGFSTLDGLLMGTRCGSLDPGVILHLLRDGMDTASLTDLLYNQSGLQGISGLSADMRTLLASDHSAARQAVEQFCYTLVRQIGSHAAALQGLDCLVFTGGIGERAAAIRERVCAQLSWLGLQIDTTANQQQAGLISGSSRRVAIRVIPTNEERVIARHTLELLA